MKKFLFILTFLSVLLMGFLFTEASELQPATEGIPEIYTDILRTSEYNWYALYDIDENGFPELILAENPYVKFSQCQIYTYEGNKVTDLGIYPVIYGIYAYNGNGILFADGGTGLLCHNRFYLENNELKKDDAPYISYCIAPGIEEYTHNGNLITKARYDELSDKVTEVEFSNTPFRNESITVLLDGKEVDLDQPPVMINNNVMVPIRAIFEKLGYTLEWLPAISTATATKENHNVIVQINNPSIIHGGSVYQCEVSPVILSNRTLVPLRAISECTGCMVSWDTVKRTVSITTN